MVGNVSERVSDWYQSDYYDVSPYENPEVPPSGTDKVLRGGGFHSPASSCRAAERIGHGPTVRSGGFGFRLARTTNGGH